jgi:hypothetical protein
MFAMARERIREKDALLNFKELMKKGQKFP